MKEVKIAKSHVNSIDEIEVICYICGIITMVPSGEYEICVDCYFKECAKMDEEEGEISA